MPLTSSALVASESLKVVEKAWGHEEWIVNEDEYCGKFLHLNKGATCSYHYHPIKRETFRLIEGEVDLNVDGEQVRLRGAITIRPGTPHQFTGITNAIILEVSSHHDDADVVRITESTKC